MKDLAACAPETTATLRSSPEQSPSEADSHAMTASTLAMSGSEDDTASDPPSLSPAVAPSPAIKEWEPRLQLVVDIDHTLVHSVVGMHSNPRLQWLSGHSSNSNQGEYYRLKCGMKTSLRPDSIAFLCQASKHYDISLCTLGTRGYAMEVARLLSRLGAPPVHSIHSRETLALALRDGERVKSLKPIGFLPERTVIVDDLWRVWPYDRANLLLCPPYLYFPEGYGEYSGFPGASKKEKWVGGGVHGGAQGSKGGDRKGSKVVTGGREAQGFAGEGNGARRMDTVTRMSHMGLKSISLILDAIAAAFEASGPSPTFNVQNVIAAHRAKILKGCVVQFVTSDSSRPKKIPSLRDFLPLLNLAGGRTALQLHAHTMAVRENLEELVRCYGGQCADDAQAPHSGKGVPVVYHRVASGGHPPGRFLAESSIIGGSTPVLRLGVGDPEVEPALGFGAEGGARGEVRQCFTDEEGGMETRSLFGESDNESESDNRGEEGERDEGLKGFELGLESPLVGTVGFSTIREEASVALDEILEEEAEREEEWDPEGGVPRANSARLGARPRLPGRGGAPRAVSMHEIVVTPDMLRESPLDAGSDTPQVTHSDAKQARHPDSRNAPECDRDLGASAYSDAAPAEEVDRKGVAECQLATPAGSSLARNLLGREELLCTDKEAPEAAGPREGNGFAPVTPGKGEGTGSALCQCARGVCKGRVYPEDTCGTTRDSPALASSGGLREAERPKEAGGEQAPGVPGPPHSELPEERGPEGKGDSAAERPAEKERSRGEGSAVSAPTGGEETGDQQAREEDKEVQTDGTENTTIGAASYQGAASQAAPPGALGTPQEPLTPPSLPTMKNVRKPSTLLPHSTGSIELLAPHASLEGMDGGFKAVYEAPGQAVRSPSPGLSSKHSLSPSPSRSTGPTPVPRSSSLRRQASLGTPGSHQQKGQGPTNKVSRQASGSGSGPTPAFPGSTRESPSRARWGALSFSSPARGRSPSPAERRSPSGGTRGRPPGGTPGTPQAAQGLAPLLGAFREGVGMSPLHGKRGSSPSPARHTPGTPSKPLGQARGTPPADPKLSGRGIAAAAGSGSKGRSESPSPSLKQRGTPSPGRPTSGVPKPSKGPGDPSGASRKARSPSPRHHPVMPRRVLKPAPPRHSHSLSCSSGTKGAGGSEAKAGGLPPAVTHVVAVPTSGSSLWSQRYTMGVPRASGGKTGRSQLLSALWVIDSCTSYEQGKPEYYTL